MTYQTWVAALAPKNLSHGLAGELSPQEARHQIALTSVRWHELLPIAAALDLHPDTAAVVVARARELCIFPLACTLLNAGHAEQLAPLLGSEGDYDGDDTGDLTSWFNWCAIDWDDLVAVLTIAVEASADVILRAYLSSVRPDGDLLDAVKARVRHLLPALNALLVTADRWDVRTATHLCTKVLLRRGLKEEESFFPQADRTGPAPISDADTWAALTCPAGCSRLAFALAIPDQDVPASVVPAMVELARTKSPALMWALLTCHQNLNVAVSTPEMTALVADQDYVRLYRTRPGGATGGANLLTHYGRVIDESTKVRILTGADLSNLAHWSVEKVLTVDDADELRAALASQCNDVAELLAFPVTARCDWEEVVTNPLLVELIMNSPTFLRLLLRPDLRSHPTWSNEAHREFGAWLRPRLGDDVAVWRAFSKLMENPGKHTTTDLVAAAHATKPSGSTAG